MTDHHCHHWLKKKLPSSFCVISCSQARQSNGERGLTRPKYNPLVNSLDAWMAAWILSVASSCFFPPVDCALRGMTSRLPMYEPRRSGNRLKPQHWKSDGPQRLRRPLRKRTKIGTTTAMPIGPSTPRVILRFLKEVCAHWWRMTDRRR